jgi:phosphonate transport system ATP-binding protein
MTGLAQATPPSCNDLMAAPGDHAVLRIAGLSLRYPTGKLALNDIDLHAAGGEFVVILGSNGSGKSSMLRCIVRLQEPTAGQVNVAGNDMIRLHGKALRQARMRIGVIGQTANLVRRRNVVANVICGALARHNDVRTAIGLLPQAEIGWAHKCLAHVGLGGLARQRASTLSGGQAQRVAIARALAQQPLLLLADEPVASLDPEAAADVMRLLRRLADEGLAVLCVLHQPELARHYADRIIGLIDGRIAFRRRACEINADDIDQLYERRAA